MVSCSESVLIEILSAYGGRGMQAAVSASIISAAR